jgi:hypothetical protein
MYVEATYKDPEVAWSDEAINVSEVRNMKNNTIYICEVEEY